MLQGDAKRDYQRDYMRRKRAGKPTSKPKVPKQPKVPKPKKPWEPTQRMIGEVEHWFYLWRNRRWHLRGIGYDVVAGLDPYNEDGSAKDAAWTEALQRYRTLRAEQRVERKRKQAERDAPPPPNRCSFCDEPASADRVLIGSNRFPLICEPCNIEAAAIFARLRSEANQIER